MGNRLSKIYTRTGDKGTTALANGERFSKKHEIFVAMGDVDELNSHIGMIIAYLNNQDTIDKDKTLINSTLTAIQHLLFNLGGELAMPDYQGIANQHILWLEKSIDEMNDKLPPLKDFILPKGDLLVCQIHIARSVARRAERACVTLKDNHIPIRYTALQFINRLSDYLFVLARFLTPNSQISETLWNSKILDNIHNM